MADYDPGQASGNHIPGPDAAFELLRSLPGFSPVDELLAGNIAALPQRGILIQAAVEPTMHGGVHVTYYSAIQPQPVPPLREGATTSIPVDLIVERDFGISFDSAVNPTEDAPSAPLGIAEDDMSPNQLAGVDTAHAITGVLGGSKNTH